MGNGQYIKQVKSSKKLSVSSEDISSKGSTVKYDLNDLDSTGVINSSQLDLTKITGNRSDAAQGINYISESNLYKDIWESGKDFEYEIYDDGSILIKNDGVGIGFTNADGFQSILNKYYVENSDINIPDPLYEEKPEEQEIVLSEDEQRYVDLFISPTSNPNFSRNSVKEMFNPKKADRNPEAVGRGSIPYKDLGGGSYIRYYSTGYPQEFYNARTNQLTEYSADGKVLRRITYTGKPSEKKVSSFIEYSYNEEGNISKVTGLKGEVTEINYYYGKGGTVYKESVLKDGRHELISYDNDGKMVSKVIGEYDGTIHSSKSDLDIPKIKGDQSVYRDGKIREKYCTNGDYEVYNKNGLSEKHLANGLIYKYANNEVTSVSFADTEGNSVIIDVLNDERISKYVDYNNIQNIDIQDGKKVLYFKDGSSIEVYNNVIYGKNANGNINFGYNINENNELSNISLFDVNNIYSLQYGGRQAAFRDSTDVLLSDPLIYDELEKTFPGSSYQQKYNYLNSIAGVCCGSVAVANSTFQEYEGREEEFRNTFGFDMYSVDANGNRNYNWELMTLKFYDYSWIKENGWTIYDYYNDPSVKGFYSNHTTSFENFMRDEYGINVENKHYVDDELGTYSTETGNNGVTNDTTLFYDNDSAIQAYNKIMESNPDSVTINATYYRLVNKNDSSDVFYSPNSSHAMTILGVENNQLVVSSFGKQYYIDFNNTEYVDFNVIDYK